MTIDETITRLCEEQPAKINEITLAVANSKLFVNMVSNIIRHIMLSKSEGDLVRGVTHDMIYFFSLAIMIGRKQMVDETPERIEE